MIHTSTDTAIQCISRAKELEMLRESVRSAQEESLRLSTIIMEQETRMRVCEVEGCYRSKAISCMCCYEHKCEECNLTRCGAGTLNEAWFCNIHKCRALHCFNRITYRLYCDNHQNL